jgi:hypothetical protein
MKFRAISHFPVGKLFLLRHLWEYVFFLILSSVSLCILLAHTLAWWNENMDSRECVVVGWDRTKHHTRSDFKLLLEPRSRRLHVEFHIWTSQTNCRAVAPWVWLSIHLASEYHTQCNSICTNIQTHWLYVEVKWFNTSGLWPSQDWNLGILDTISLVETVVLLLLCWNHCLWKAYCLGIVALGEGKKLGIRISDQLPC